MKFQITCTRCGCTQATAPDSHREWDEIHCEECGEFLDTCGHFEDRHAAGYHVQALNMSRSLILQMARENGWQADPTATTRRSA